MQFNDRSGALATVNTTYAATDTTVVLSSGHGARIPTTPCVALWYNSTDYTYPTDDPLAEVIGILSVSTDTLTVTRGQCGTAPSAKNTGGKTYKMAPMTLGQDYANAINTRGVAHTTIGDVASAASDFKTSGLMADNIAPSTSGNVAACTLGGSTTTGAPIVCVANSQYSASGVANSGNATDDTLFTYTLPANALKNVGDWVRVTSNGQLAGNTHNCLIKTWFGGTAYISSGTVSSTGAFAFVQRMTVVKTGASTQMVNSEDNYCGTTANIARVKPTAASVTDTAGIIIKVTGQCTTASEILGNSFLVEFGGCGAGL